MKKTVIFIHKWLGIGLALLFLMWFVSGLVLYYVPFPSLTQAERLAGSPPLHLAGGCCLTARQGAARAGVAFIEARLGMLGDAPVWRLLVTQPQRHWIALDAGSGELLAPLDQAGAMALAGRFSGRRTLRAELLERDQWTVAQGFNAHRPLLRVELDGDDGLELYVSPGGAEVVLETRRAERAWNWIGAVPHWLYFTALRRWPDSWHNVVVGLSLPGVLLAATGCVLGVWQLYLNRARWIPYRPFWMRWHHILGLAASVVTLTWIFSGLLSMNPFGVFAGRGALPSERQVWSGAAATATLDPARALALAAPLQASEIELLAFQGQAWYRLRGRHGQALLRADLPAPRPLTALPEAAIDAALRGLRAAEPAVGPPALTRLDAYDDLYYARVVNDNTRHSRPLPVWRARWADGVTAYADPASLRIVLRSDDAGRWQRLLYNGLHSFDFAPLLARPWLRTGLVVLLSLLGIVMSITACVLAWRALFPRRQARR